MDYILEAKTPEVEQYLALRQSVGWHRLPADTVANSLSSSIFNVCAVHADEVIGFGRVVGDGYIYFYLQDIIVHPDWQGQGIGKAIIQHLYDKVLAVAVPGAFFGLMAANGASPLYEKFALSPVRKRCQVCHFGLVHKVDNIAIELDFIWFGRATPWQ
jgi:GNAT superfamily N-acetyltransferase